jgi:hypothetical protein
MKLFKMTRKFRNDEEGAVTVDWVVLTGPSSAWASP